MAKVGRTLEQLAQEITRRSEVKKDFIAPASRLAMQVIDAVPALVLQGSDQAPMELQEIAHSQVAEYAGIPMAYYRRMLGEAPELLAGNVNRWLGDKGQERRMVRSLDGRARAVLSDSYRALENEDLAEVILPVLLDQNLLIISCEITESRMYIKAVDRSIERDVPVGKKMGDASHSFFDTLSPAITISNSEVGHGSLAIETGVYTRACTNLAMFGSNMRKYHTGKRAELSDDVYALLTDDTKRATDKAVWMQVRDLVKSAFDLARFDATIAKLGAAGADIIPADDVVEVVKRASRSFSLTEGEQKGILGRLIEGGNLSRYGLHSAITRYSQDEVVAYDRATTLERLGGQVIELPRNDWERLVIAA